MRLTELCVCACVDPCVCVFVCLSVCLSVCLCLSGHAILAVCAIKSIMKDTIVFSVRFEAILKLHFSLNCLIRKLEHFYLPWQGRPFLVAYYVCNASYTLHYMFAKGRFTLRTQRNARYAQRNATHSHFVISYRNAM